MPSRNSLLVCSMPTALASERDDEQAIDWYRKAAKQGPSPAHKPIWALVTPRRSRAFHKIPSRRSNWFRKAAEQDDASAQFNLGVMYAGKRGVTARFRRVMQSGSASLRLIEPGTEACLSARDFGRGTMTEAGLEAQRACARLERSSVASNTTTARTLFNPVEHRSERRR